MIISSAMRTLLVVLKSSVILCLWNPIFGLVPKALDELLEQHKIHLSEPWIEVDVCHQLFTIWSDGTPQKNLVISTGKKGCGQLLDSEKTPLGIHKICEKYGDNAPKYSIFKYKKFRGKIWDPQSPTSDDLILSRILVLEGLQKGFNRGKNKEGLCVDSYARGIYIHATAEENLIGIPSSHGCIRMKNSEIIEIYDQIPIGTLVWIHL